MPHFNRCLLPVEMCPKCRRYVSDKAHEGDADGSLCELLPMALADMGTALMALTRAHEGDAMTAEQWKCSEPECFRPRKVRDLCRYHYDKQYREARRMAELPAGWQPPAALSPEWQRAAAVRAERSQPHSPAQSPTDRPCGLPACSGTAQRGSDLCAAHHHWRAAQRKLAARGLA